MAIDREKVLQAAQKFVEKKKYDKAVAEYQKIIQEDPNDARTLLKIGDLQLKMEAYAEAISTYERVGRFYAAQGFSLKAIAVYKQIREIIHKHVPQLVDRYAHIPPKLAELYQQLGLVSDALAALDEVASRLQQQNRDGEAIDVYRKIVALDPSNPLPHLRLAEALSRAKDNDGAATEFSLAASQLVKAGRRDDALKVIERLLHHRADPAQARIAAELYLARNQPKDGMQALAKLQISFQANPKDIDTLALLARAFQSIGQANKAIEVHKEMARIARDQGKMDLFRDIVARLLQVAPNDEGVRQLAAKSEAPPPAAIPTPPPPAAELPPTVTAPVARAAPPPPPARQAPPPPPPRRSEPEPEEISALEEIPPSFAPPPRSAQTQDDDGPAMDVGDGEGVELVEGESAQLDASEQIAALLDEAIAARTRGDVDTCLELLRSALEIDPRHLDVRAALRETLLESGDTAGAVEELLLLASMQLEELDGEGATRSLQEVLELDPRNERAIQTLRELGYEVEEPARPGAQGAPLEFDSTEHEAPLPAYDLEEIGPADEAPVPAGLTGPSEPPPVPRRAIDAIDDPFGEGPGPLPSFPVDEAESDPAFELRRQSQPPAGPVLEASLEAADDPRDFTRPVQRDEIESQIANTRPTAELEEALEEAEFFASRGLYEDARAVLNDQLARLPNHPLLHERMEELEAQERGSGAQASGTRSVPLGSGGEDRSFDIAASLDALESLDESAPMPAEGNALVDGQIDVEEVFAKFKEGVQKQISQDDGQAHYDLGLAYKEMALHDDAIREFEVAARDRNMTCVCESMIGMMHLERGNVNEAIDAFLRGLHAQVRTSDQETSLWFELGGAYESKSMFKDALAYYQRVARREPNYRDVQDRVRRLSHYASIAPMRQAAVGADDEFDRAFDEIIGTGKLP